MDGKMGKSEVQMDFSLRYLIERILFALDIDRLQHVELSYTVFCLINIKKSILLQYK